MQLAVDSVHLIVLSTATICIHFKQTDGTSPENVCSLPKRVNRLEHNYLWRCRDLQGYLCRLSREMYSTCPIVIFSRDVPTQVTACMPA